MRYILLIVTINFLKSGITIYLQLQVAKITYRMVKNCLLIGATLHRKGVKMDIKCLQCQTKTKSSVQIMAKCQIAHETWNSLKLEIVCSWANDEDASAWINLSLDNLRKEQQALAGFDLLV